MSSADDRLTAYPHRLETDIRYGDTDRQGHVNNAVYATLFEHGRTALFNDHLGDVVTGGREPVLVRLVVDFRRELHWPGRVTVATAVARTRHDLGHLRAGRVHGRRAGGDRRDGRGAARQRDPPAARLERGAARRPRPVHARRVKPRTRAAASARPAPATCAAMNASTPAGAMPAKVSVKDRAMVTAGFANEVEAVNQ